MPIPLSHARIVATLACSLAILLLSSSAAALPDVCRLSRSPFIFEHSLPPELQCQFDQDGNGLDDQVEREIAACFVPTFKYDSEENAIAGSEPNVLFTAQRSGPWEVRLKLAALWLDDGGFNADDDEGARTITMVTARGSVSRWRLPVGRRTGPRG